MNECWTDGDLRAYLDRELPGPDRDRAAAHLAVCGECGARFREIKARAERVATALSALADGISTVRAPRRAAPKVRLWPRWAAAAAVAAGLALVLISPKVQAPSPAVARQKAEFVALDNEPIDAGLVVRVSVGPNNVQADVIFSADGRARAYRLVDAN
jgi:anti-sigma factor RsiW